MTPIIAGTRNVEELSSSQQQRKRPNGEKKSVVFSYAIHTLEIEAVTPENDQALIDTLWYGKKDYLAFRDRDQRILDIIDNMDEQKQHLGKGCSLDAVDSYCCTRGLENRTKLGGHVSRQTQMEAREAVLYEQYLQTYDEYNSDSSALADTYRRFSSRPKLQARVSGFKDAQYVHDHVRNNNSSINDTNEKDSIQNRRRISTKKPRRMASKAA